MVRRLSNGLTSSVRTFSAKRLLRTASCADLPTYTATPSDTLIGDGVSRVRPSLPSYPCSPSLGPAGVHEPRGSSTVSSRENYYFEGGHDRVAPPGIVRTMPTPSSVSCHRFGRRTSPAIVRG